MADMAENHAEEMEEAGSAVTPACEWPSHPHVNAPRAGRASPVAPERERGRRTGAGGLVGARCSTRTGEHTRADHQGLHQSCTWVLAYALLLSVTLTDS
jgi:hypothetical protein